MKTIPKITIIIKFIRLKKYSLPQSLLAARYLCCFLYSRSPYQHRGYSQCHSSSCHCWMRTHAQSQMPWPYDWELLNVRGLVCTQMQLHPLEIHAWNREDTTTEVSNPSQSRVSVLHEEVARKFRAWSNTVLLKLQSKPLSSLFR